MNALVLVLAALCLIPSAHASPGLLRTLTLNVNNMGNNWEKNHGIINIIRQTMPHVVILTETWQPVNAPLKLPVYKEKGAFRITSIYATHFTPSIGSVSNGVTLLINKAIAFTALPHATISEGLGRIVAVDLTLPDLLGRVTRCRLIGIYAPARSQGRDLGSFWNAVQRFTEVDHEWIVAGDFNAFLNPWEEKGGTREPHYTRTLDELRRAYRTFLHNTRGLDAWDQNRPVYVERDWTCRGHARPDAKKILDRFAYSHRIALDSIRTLGEVDRTNHRPVAANFRLGAMTPAARDVLKNRAPPRLAPPKPRNAAEKYSLLNTKISDKLERTPPPLRDPKTDGECDELLRYCHEVLTPAAESTFGRRRNGPVNPSLYNQDSRASDELAKRKHATNRLIRAIDEDREDALIAKDGEVQREIADMPGFGQSQKDRQAMREIVRQHRRKLERAYHEERREAARRTARATQKGEFKDVLKGGRIKEMFKPHEVTNPALLRRGQPTDSPATYASTPVARLETFTDYFERLYQPEDLPVAAKPWLTSPAAGTMRGKTSGSNALQWPILLTVPGLRAILTRGNQRPSPGPDGWEKWVLRRCNDEFLTLVTNLLNYILLTNHFPERLRENYDSPLYKKKDPTQPENYRGVVYSQCLFAILSSHFAHTLQNYCWDRDLLPKTQIATQRGVQAGDLTMFLGEVHTAADLAGTTIYGIKRDHTKGFDLFHQSGFADAIDFYGLPEAMLDFELARTSKAYLRIKSQDGIGKRDIVTSGQTKQGDAASPIKYTLAMGMLHHWLGKGGRLRAQNIAHVRTRNLQANVRHTAEDGAPLALLCVEAMDDSIWFAPSWRDLQTIVGLTEEFQAAYGVRTAWDSDEKTVCFVMGRTPADCRGPRGEGTVTFGVMDGEHRVPITSKPSLLRTEFLDQRATLDQILRLVDEFPIPHNPSIPLSILRRAVGTLLMAQIRPRLNLQPLSPTMALQVDRAITRKITSAIGLRMTRSNILSLPLSHHGFDFPSVYTINGQVAVNAMLRGLNHHLTPFRQMARMTLSNWSCQGNSCVSPLEKLAHIEPPRRGGKRKAETDKPRIPPTWAAAHEYLKLARIQIIATDQSDYKTQSVTHVANRVGVLTAKPAPPGLNVIIEHMADCFTLDQTLTKCSRLLARRNTPAHLRSAAEQVLRWSETLALPYELAVMDATLFQTRDRRRNLYDRIVADAFTQNPDLTPMGLWATDGSHREAVRGIRSTTAAVVGRQVATLALTGQHSTSLHGEMLAHIAVQLQIRRESPGSLAARSEQLVLTDHMGTVRTSQALQHGPPRDTHKHRPAHELHNWLHEVARGSLAPTAHIKAHTDREDIRSTMNQLADEAAARGHSPHFATYLPPLTGWMRDFVPYKGGGGYVPDNWSSTLERILNDQLFRAQPAKLQSRLLDNVILPVPATPDYFYRRSPTSLTTKFQYILRTGSFPTGLLEWKLDKTTAHMCLQCGFAVDDLHHIFVECPAWDRLRQEAIAKAEKLCSVKAQARPRGGGARPDPDDEDPERAALCTRYFTETIYGIPDRRTEYYLGKQATRPKGLGSKEEKFAHNMAITLTSRIAGSYLHSKTGSWSYQAVDRVSDAQARIADSNEKIE